MGVLLKSPWAFALVALSSLLPLVSAGTIPNATLWPNGVIPYAMDRLTTSRQAWMRQAMYNWEQRTCIRFVKTDLAKDSGYGYFADFTTEPSCGEGTVGRMSSGPGAQKACTPSIYPGRFSEYSGSMYILGLLIGINPSSLVNGMPSDNDLGDVNTIYNCDPGYQLKVPECNTAQAVDADQSSYRIYLDFWVTRYMVKHNFNRVRVRQYCNGDSSTENWGETTLDLKEPGSGPYVPYIVKTNRCKKRRNRHVASFEVDFPPPVGSTDPAPGLTSLPRKVCPVDKNNKGVFSKAVNLNDDAVIIGWDL